MNITYIIGIVLGLLVFLLGCVMGISIGPAADQAREASLAAGKDLCSLSFMV